MSGLFHHQLLHKGIKGLGLGLGLVNPNPLHRGIKGFRPHLRNWQACRSYIDYTPASAKPLFTFEVARKMARARCFPSVEDFLQYDAPGPYRVPKDPEVVYKGEWKGWEDFLGLFYTYQHARGLIVSNGIKTEQEYLFLQERDQRLPYRPDLFYKDQWEGYKGGKIYMLYLLVNTKTRQTYIGVSCNPIYSLRQQNGELFGGAPGTRHNRPHWRFHLQVRNCTKNQASSVAKNCKQLRRYTDGKDALERRINLINSVLKLYPDNKFSILTLI